MRCKKKKLNKNKPSLLFTHTQNFLSRCNPNCINFEANKERNGKIISRIIYHTNKVTSNFFSRKKKFCETNSSSSTKCAQSMSANKFPKTKTMTHNHCTRCCLIMTKMTFYYIQEHMHQISQFLFSTLCFR